MQFHSDDLSPAAAGKVLARAEAEKVLRRHLQSSFRRRELQSLCASLGLGGGADWSSDRGRVPEAGMEMRLLGALRRGDLVLVQRAEGGGRGRRSEEAAPPPASPAPSQEPEPTTWIEFQLVGEDDRPIGGVKYRATLPSGSVREGVTRSSGLVRFDGVPEGTWEFTFPELDQDAWEKA